MKTILMTLFLSLSVLIVSAQEKTKKQIKEEQELVKQKQIEAFIESREFEFVADRANPQGVRSISMTTNGNFFRIEKDTIHSSMPFFGRAYSGVGYGGGDGGLDFKGLAKDYTLKKEKKSYIIKANVRGDKDSYDIILEIYFGGSAYLSINSSKRSRIGYNGEVHKLPVN
jgi:hypothetical protein